MKKILIGLLLSILASSVMVIIKIAAYYLYKAAYKEGINVDF